MKAKLKIPQPVSFSIIFMMIMLIQFSCKKKNDNSYISKEDFINHLKGDWYVEAFHQINSVNEDVDISRSKNLVFWQNYQHTYELSIDDSLICTLPKIENIQDWTISESGNELLLETVDLCAGHKNYKIAYSNYRYINYIGGTEKDALMADIDLVGLDTITLDEFTLYFINTAYPQYVYLEFNISDGSSKKLYTFRRSLI